MKKKFLIGLLIFVATLIVISLVYLNTYYKADKSVEDCLKNTTVKVEKINKGYFFDGPGEDSALIFYPGAKVEYTSYAPLMNKLADNGIDTFLVKMPFNIAFFDSNAADPIINKYKYDNYYIGGHSLGGVVAANYLNKKDNFKGIIFLASYSTTKISDELNVLSIYGSEDGVLNQKAYQKNKKNFPKNYQELIIDGANHANFGYYGTQKGDKKAKISREEQIEETASAIIDFVY